MDKIKQKYLPCLKSNDFILSTVVAFLFLGISLVISYHAGQYASEKGSNPVTDIILSNTRVYNLDFIFVYGSVMFWIFVTFLCLFSPKKIPFTLKSIALFVCTRSLFISLTHIAPFPNRMMIDPGTVLSYFTFGGDLFFSGHTGLPFLLALIFWEHKRLRALFLVVSVVFAVIVLLGHVHYSIDVLAAFYITFGIYHIARIVFKNDLLMFDSEGVKLI